MKEAKGKGRVQPHRDKLDTVSDFSNAFGFLKATGPSLLETAAGTKFTAEATESMGRHVIRFRQGGKEYARAYGCCWGRYYNCNRTRIGMYCAALDSACLIWFRRKVAEIRSEVMELPFERQEQLKRELEEESER